MKPSKRPAPLAFQLVICCLMIALLMPMLGATFITRQINKEQVLVLKWYGAAKGTVINDRADRWFRLWAVDSGLMDRVIHGEAAVNKVVQTATNQLQAHERADGQDDAGNAGDGGLDVTSSVDTSKALRVEDSKHRLSSDGLPPPESGTQGSAFGSSRNTNSTSTASSTKPRAMPFHSPLGSEGVHHLWQRWITAVFALVYFVMLRLSALLSLLPMLIPVIAAVLITGGAVRKLKWHGFGGVSSLQYRSGIRMWGWLGALAVGMLAAPGALPPVMVGFCMLLSCVGISMATANRQKPA